MKKIIAIILYIIGIISYLTFFFQTNILLVLFSLACIVSFTFITSKKNLTIRTLLIMYFVGLSYYLFYSSTLARSGILDVFNISSFHNWLEMVKNAINIIPFKTIISYLKAFVDLKAQVHTSGLMLNIVGNLFCLAPLAILLPLYKEKYKNLKNYAISILILSLAIEIIQLLTLNGAFDIDDIILNSSGAILAFLLINPAINPLIENILFKKKNQVKIKNIILSILIIFIVFSSLLTLSLIREHKVNEYINHISGYEIRLETKTICTTQEKNFLYEDNMYKYYLTCGTPSENYVYLNEEKHSLEEYFSGNLDYMIYIDRLIYAGLDVIKEAKYEKFMVCENGNLLGNIYEIYDAPIYFHQDYENNYIDGKSCLIFYMEPKKSGEMTLEVNFNNYSGVTERKREFNFLVDENLNISYTEKNK